MTRSNTLLSYSFPQFAATAHLACSLTSALPNPIAGTQSNLESPLPMPDHDPQTHPTPLPPPFLQGIPSSVKGAPAHLRQVIRKRQNSESAKRSRQRRKHAAGRFYRHFDQQCQRISALEKRVAHLTDLVQKKHAAEAAHQHVAPKQEPTTIGNVPQPPSQHSDATRCLESGEKPLSESPNDRLPSSPPSVDSLEQPWQEPDSWDLTSDAAITFDEDMEVLLDSCTQLQYSLNEVFVNGSPSP